MDRSLGSKNFSDLPYLLLRGITDITILIKPNELKEVCWTWWPPYDIYTKLKEKVFTW